jgi:ribose transport system substrate-binding protein
MKKRVLAVLMSSMLTLAMLSGCSTEGSSSTGSTSTDETKKDGYVIGLAMNTQTNPFFVSVKEGCEKAAEEYGIELIVTDAQDDPTIQHKDIENLITKNPDAIIIDTCDSDAIVAAVELCNEANIPVFTMDREANGGEIISHIGYDAIKSGNLAAEFLVEQLNGTGKIVELQGTLGTNVAQNRSQGFNEIISKNSGMEIVACQTADFDRATAMSVMENILQANPQIDGLYAANDEMLLGALEAIAAAGRSGEIVVVGCDALDETMEGIKAGTINATIAEPPFFLGKAIVKAAYNYLQGQTVEKTVILDNELVTIDNVYDIVTAE